MAQPGHPLWSDGDRLYPCVYRIHHKDGDGKTKNVHFADMLRAGVVRGFRPQAVRFDCWYAGVENLKKARDCGWLFVTRFKMNRKVRIDRGGRWRWSSSRSRSTTGG